ncbi:MAG: radical protein, partial [Chthonomonadales bacterium]|nr:radical protein [Chthonomonadales bacterium]
ENNVNLLEDTLNLCLDRGIAFVRCVPVARVKKGKAANVTDSLHKQLIETMIRFTLKHQNSIEFAKAAGSAQVPASIEALTTRRCMAGKQFFGITPDKKIVPCPLIADHPDVPSVYFKDAASFEQLGQKMDILFQSMENRLGGICGICEFREVCYGGCLAEKLSFDRQLADEQPICTKLILEELAQKFDQADIDRMVQSWVAQLQNSLEATKTNACMRHAPFWSLNFKIQDHWAKTGLRFS